MRLCCFYGYLAHVFYWLVSYESQLHSFRYFMFSHILRPTLLDCLNINLNCRKLFQRTNPSITDYHFTRLLSNEYTAYKKFRLRSLWVLLIYESMWVNSCRQQNYKIFIWSTTYFWVSIFKLLLLLDSELWFNSVSAQQFNLNWIVSCKYSHLSPVFVKFT